MIIYADQPGQLGNMLFIYESLIAWGMKNDVRVVNLGFYPYLHYFEGSSRESRYFNLMAYKLSAYLSRALIRLKVNGRFLSALGLQPDEYFNLDIDGEPLASGVHFLRGWQFRAPSSSLEFEDYIRSFFRPEKCYREIIDDFYAKKLTSPRSVIVGVHVRRGDYRDFEGGRYFYELEVYESLMRKVVEFFPLNDITFLICSNEALGRRKAFSNERDNCKVVYGLGHELLDLYSLAKCDFILGPPSTFSMWASKYGQVPLYIVKEPTAEFNVDNFRVYEARPSVAHR